MGRSTWKPLYLHNEFVEQIGDSGKEEIFAYNRASVLTKPMLGMQIHIYNGMRFYSVTVSLDMLGHRLGEFSPTRKKPVAKKDKIKKKGKK